MLSYSFGLLGLSFSRCEHCPFYPQYPLVLLVYLELFLEEFLSQIFQLGKFHGKIHSMMDEGQM